MNYDERISRMEASGIISPEQAAELRAGVGHVSSTPAAGAHRTLPLGPIAVGSLFLLAVVLLLALGSGGETGGVQIPSEMMNKAEEVGAMSKGFSTGLSLFVILIPVVFSVLGFVWINNDLVEKEEAVLAGWSQVESNYQRRADLVPNLVETVRSFAEHEASVVEDVTSARNPGDLASAMKDLELAQRKAEELGANADDKLGDETYMKSLAAAQNEVGDRVTRLFGLVENYPQLRSSDNFLALQDQLEGTENRVNVARLVFNDSVRAYNSAIRKMPASLVAGLGDFSRKAYFEADEGAERAVQVELGD